MALAETDFLTTSADSRSDGPIEPDASWDRRSGLPVLHGPGVTLREPEPDDAGLLCQLLATREVTRFMNRPPDRPEAFAGFIQWARDQRRLGRNFCYGIVPDGSDRPVGLIQVRQVETDFAVAEWGFAIGRPYWGTDLFARAGRIAIDFIFRYAGTHRLEARSALQNGRANGALKKLGATPEGVLRESFVVDGEPAHQVLWALRAEDWCRDGGAPCYRLERQQGDTDATEVETSQPSAPRAALPAWCSRLPVLRGAGVTLRELRSSDAAPMVRLVATPAVGRYMPPPPGTVPGFLDFIAWSQRERAAGRYLCMGVVPDACDHAVGLFQLHRVDQVFNLAEWGFALGQPYWGTGLFMASARLFLDFVFDTVGVRRLEARAAQANERANAALRKLGAAREGAMRRSFLLGGEYYDDYLWSILADDRVG